MRFSFQCDRCNHEIITMNEIIGQSVKCGNCDAYWKVPINAKEFNGVPKITDITLVKCPNCGMSMQRSSKYCTACKTTIPSTIVQVLESEQTQGEIAPKIKCPFCAEKIIANQKQCPICKEPFVNLCKFCKEEIAQGAIKCKHCGSMQYEQINPQSNGHKTVKEAYFSKKGMGLIDLIPGIRDLPFSLRIIVLIIGLFVFMVIIGLLRSN